MRSTKSISQKERLRIIEQLRQFTDKKSKGLSAKLSEQITHTVCFIYNQGLKNQKECGKYMIRGQSETIEAGLKIVEKRVAGRMHVDLQIIA